MSKSRLEKFLYALYSLDSSDLPNPLSRIEELYKCLVTGDEAPTFEPLSRVEKYLMAILGVYDVNELPNPISRVEVLLYKLATGDDNLDDVKSFLSEHEELLAEIIRNGGVGGNIDIEYILYSLSTEFNTLYNTAEKPIKSAILKGNTGYRDIDTGEILKTFEEGRNLELVSVKMPVLKTTGKNLFDGDFYLKQKYGTNIKTIVHADDRTSVSTVINVRPNTKYYIKPFNPSKLRFKGIMLYDANGDYLSETLGYFLKGSFVTPSNCHYITFEVQTEDWSEYTLDELKSQNYQIEEGSVESYYEPYKSNILTVNEEVELRKAANVQDELNLITGELTQRIGEVVLNGQGKWTICGSSYQPTDTNYINYDLIVNDIKTSTPILCDTINTRDWGISSTKINSRSISAHSSNKVLRLCIEKTIAPNVESLKTYLSTNIAKVQYRLANESVKTVDLSVVDQDGNDTKLSTFNDITYVTLSSEELIPEAELEVATKNKEVLNTMSLEMDDIFTTQNALKETSNTQSENVDATMIATTEIYEGLL